MASIKAASEVGAALAGDERVRENRVAPPHILLLQKRQLLTVHASAVILYCHCQPVSSPAYRHIDFRVPVFMIALSGSTVQENREQEI